jgi:hypothetical protein
LTTCAASKSHASHVAPHRKLDAAVSAAYGWQVNLADEEILARLLALNLQRST